MVYSQGGLVEATDYNNRAANINAIWGSGAGSNGYGQSTTLSNVAATNTVSATNWASMIARLDSMRAHQSATTSGITQPSAGGTVTYLSAIDTQISTVITNKLVRATVGTGVVLGNPQISNAAAWVSVNTKEVLFTFADTNAVRYFFNAGGYVQMSCQQTGGSTSKYVYWNAFLANVIGTMYLGSNYCGRSGTGGTATVSNTGVGYWNLTTSYQRLFLIYQAYGIADYNSNYVDIYAKITAANQVSLIFYMVDGAADVFNDTVDGTNATYTSYVPPETTYLANTWGAVTCTTITNTQG
jgi:hypothetical protein